MPKETIPVESEVFSIDQIPEGAATEAAELDPNHTDVEYEALESPTLPETPLEFASQWRVAKALLALKAQVNTIAPKRNKDSDGTIGDQHHCGSPHSTSDHCPHVLDSNIGVVTAMDVTNDPTNHCDANAIAESLLADQDPRVKYVIWNRRIFASYPVGPKAAWTWRSYGGANPHTKHVHISVVADKSRYDSQEAWTLSQIQPIG